MAISAKWRRIIKLAIGGALAALGLMFFWKPIAEAAKLVVIAGGLAIVVAPLCTFYEKAMSAPLAAALGILSVLIAVLLAVTAIMIPLATSLGDIFSKLAGAKDIFSQFKLDGIYDKLGGVLPSFISSAAGLAGSIADMAVAAVVAWHMLVNRKTLGLHMELFIPFSQRGLVLRGAAEARLELMMYLRGQTVIAVCVGLLSALGLFIVGIPSAIPLGLTAGVLNMIPYLGPVIACVPVGAIALTEGIVPCLMGIGVMIAVQQIDGLILSPRIVGNSTGFAPAVVMIVIFASGAVWGVAGMLVALPCLILIRTCVRVFVELGQDH